MNVSTARQALDCFRIPNAKLAWFKLC